MTALASVLALACSARLPGVQTARAQPAVAPAHRVSPDLREQVGAARPGARLKVILQLREGTPASLDAILHASGARSVRRFDRLDSVALELPAAAVARLAARPETRFVSPDRESIPTGHVSLTTGADAVRTTAGINVSGLDGTGVGIAVLDSGIDATHTAACASS
jgi:serine protease AprX